VPKRQQLAQSNELLDKVQMKIMKINKTGRIKEDMGVLVLLHVEIKEDGFSIHFAFYLLFIPACYQFSSCRV
jgi:hypothetical protein